MTIDFIKSLNLSHFKNMILPANINLHKHGILTLKQVKCMTTGTRLITSIDFYYELLKNKKLDYKQIEGIDELTSLTLANETVIQNISHNKINLNYIIELSNDSKKLIVYSKIIGC